MSKVKKVTRRKIIDQRNNHCSSTSLLNPNQSLSNLNQLPERPDLYSESPYAKRMPKMRSSSIMKDPSLNRSQGLVSPPLNVKFNSKLKSKMNMNASFYVKMKDANESRMGEIKNNIFAKRNSRDSEPFLFEVKVEELMGKQRKNGISKEIFESFREVFEEIIEKDKAFGGVLGKIKAAYEEWAKVNFEEHVKIKDQLNACTKKITEEVEYNKRLHKKIQKISRENVDFGRVLEEKESNIKAVQEYLTKITNVNLEEVPQDITSWKLLISENTSYSELCGKLKNKIKLLKEKEQTLMKICWELNQKGSSHDSVEKSEARKRKKKTNSLFSDDFSDNEVINVEPAKNKKRPSVIPVLKMEKVEPNSFTERGEVDDDDDEST